MKFPKVEEMKRCKGCTKIIWFYQRKDSEYIGNKIMYYHWNCRFPKVKW